MNDLISRSALMDRLTAVEKSMNWDDQSRSVLDAFAKFINKAPAVDAVEVVRCADCDHYENEECVNPYIWTSDGAHIWPEPDHFCSYGERRNGDG